MKRKRGHKKGKPKGPPVVVKNEASVSAVSLNTEDNSGLNGLVNDTKYDSGMEVDTPSSTGTDQPYNVASINPDGSIDKAVGKSVGHVKVKLRTSKMLGSQHTSSDAPTQSDTDKSSQQMGLERQGVGMEKMEDSANSLPVGVLGNPAKRAGSIKIKSSKVLGNSSAYQSSSAVVAQGESPRQREPNQGARYSKQELDAALTVIKKVMKMDAAEPFNVPVDPVALGIPDYFDVIDVPMDFGTICSNLENGVKYMNSELVYKDVQYIWENCNKYNNKGDYILDLMRRVKKNFMKYWTAAGLYGEQPHGSKGVESILVEDVAPSSQGKVYVKGGQSKQKTGKRHGRRHKSDCLCAICVLKRRRKEREENARLAKGLTGAGDNNYAQETKQEEPLLVESPDAEDSSSNDESLDPDANAEVEEKVEEVKLENTEEQRRPLEEKHGEEEEEEEEEDEEEEEEEEENDMEIQKIDESETPEQPQFGDRSGEELDRQTKLRIVDKSGVGVRIDTRKEDALTRHETKTAELQQQKHKESLEKHRKAEVWKNFHLENPMLLDLCGILFPDNCNSVWSGPHSLSQRPRSARTSSIHTAMEAIMK
ncbi:uncharacterized protein LOC133882613 isoform X1 [Alnus glutinosa]|uniref:uncharacterized protein LOC133882613 isoform X1 n=1 Tax=Alnus glutinosa TaxID=3517 RepID=UPI002D7A20A4|nr:uncharacterized protein LOC133882613 isoform X1 [Alnus glutinosa]